ncbi:MAG TPA: hypothetical protein VMY59_09870 [Candidatus Thermoplasmatota archaeon]|nr:hypothetical protein [Candidatus Thermoplasmatota archaeon]
MSRKTHFCHCCERPCHGYFCSECNEKKRHGNGGPNQHTMMPRRIEKPI